MSSQTVPMTQAAQTLQFEDTTRHHANNRFACRMGEARMGAWLSCVRSSKLPLLRADISSLCQPE